MPAVSGALLAAAVLLGAVLASLHLRPAQRGAPPRGLRLAHGGLGAAGLTASLASLHAQGWHAAIYTWDALALLTVALVSGVAVWLNWRPLRESRGITLVLHGFFAVVGFALLAGGLLGG